MRGETVKKRQSAYRRRLRNDLSFAMIGNLLFGSSFAPLVMKIASAWVVERSKATGCKPVGLIPYVGSNPTPCTIFRAGVAQLVERQPSKLNVASSSLVSRSIVVWNGREFRSAQVAQG